jgi:hypothetical protein
LQTRPGFGRASCCACQTQQPPTTNSRPMLTQNPAGKSAQFKVSSQLTPPVLTTPSGARRLGDDGVQPNKRPRRPLPHGPECATTWTHPRCPPPFCFIPDAGSSMSALPLADILARLAAYPALAVLRGRDPSVAAPVVPVGKRSTPNGTAATGASPYTERNGGLAVPAVQGSAGQSRPDPEAHHLGTSRCALGSPVCTVPSRRRLVQRTRLPHGAVSSTRPALSAATARDRTPCPRVAAPRGRQGMSAATVPPVTQHPGWGTRASLPRFLLCIC